MKEKISSWFSALGAKLVQLKNALVRTKAFAFVEKIFHFIGLIFHYIFFPITWIKRKTYDKLRYEQQKVVSSFLFLTPVIIGFLVFFAYPFIMSFIYSFSSVHMLDGETTLKFGYYWDGVNTIKDFFGNYKYALQGHQSFIMDLWDTVSTTVIDTVVITIFSLLIAVMLNGNFRGRAFIRAVFFLPVVFNSDALDAALVASESMLDVLNNAGTENGALTQIFDLKLFMGNIGLPVWLVTFLGNITSAIYNTISYAGVQILVFLAAIQSVPGHLYEAAKIEGASGYESFWKITLPMVSPQIVTVVVYTIVDSFLRSDINDVMDTVLVSQGNTGYHAAMAWLYIIASILILGIAVGILSKVVFYQDDKK